MIPPYPPAEPIVGIDLGTTNSLVAVAAWPDPAEPLPRILTDEHGESLLPSVVRFDGNARLIVGSDARAHAIESPLTTISSIKRLMGRSLQDAAPDLAYLSYNVVEGENQTAQVRLPDGRVVSPQEVSAHILRALRERAATALNTPVRRAVITVPAYFDDTQRQATRDAARLAGLEAVRLVNEPTAAALAYGIGLARPVDAKDQIIVVYDLGGGTFDVSVLRLARSSDDAMGSDCFQVMATAGDTHLGGDDFDHALVGLFTADIATRFGLDATAALPPATRAALLRLAESVKIRLSNHDDAVIQIDIGANETSGKSRMYERTIGRTEFESLIAPMVEKTILCCERTLRDAKILAAERADTISAIVMVGGSTRVPLVRRRVGEFFGLEPYTALNPDLVVALGAAVQGSVLSGASKKTLLLDVLPLSLGIETVGGAVAKLIMRNSTVPARASELFSTSVDSQTSIRLTVVQGEREMVADCRVLGTFDISGLPPMPAGIPKLQVTFAVDSNGVLNVSAVEERSGKRATLQVVPNHGLSREHVAKIEQESFANAREDFARHRIVDLIANSRLDLHWIGKQISRLADRLPPADRKELEQAVHGLTTLVESAAADWRSVNADAFHQAKEMLDRTSMRLHEISIAESLKAGIP